MPWPVFLGLVERRTRFEARASLAAIEGGAIAGGAAGPALEFRVKQLQDAALPGRPMRRHA